MNCQEAAPFLSPLLDSELDLVTAMRVEEHVEGCARCGQEYRELQELRREILEAKLEFVPPARLTRRVDAARRRAVVAQMPWWRRPATMAFAVAAVVLLLLVPLRLPRTSSGEDREMLDNHLRSLMASHLVDVPSSDQHTVKPWFQGKLNFSPAVPDLSAEGFVLAGGRLEMMRGVPAAAIVYKRRSHVINLFVTSAEQSDLAPVSRSIDGYNLVTWVKGGLSYRAVSDLNGGELMQFAQLVRGH
jgi:anti-sigma factor RsiW